jgi:glucose/arabinose dehydrogenase/azurin
MLRHLALIAAAALALSPARAQVALAPDDTLLFYGNSMVERLLEQGDLEAIVQLANPEKKLHFRSLAWTGDEVGYRMRPEGYEKHLKKLLAAWPAKVVVAGFGMNESFNGPAGLPEFRAQLATYLDQLARLHPKAQLVLLGPTAGEKLVGSPDEIAHSRDLASYSQVIAEAAKARGTRFVDLSAYGQMPMRPTPNVLHTDDFMSDVALAISRVILDGDALAKINPARVSEVAKAAARKQHYVAELVRPKNADLYYGVRERPEEYNAEIPRYHEMVARTEADIYAMVADPKRAMTEDSQLWLPPLPPIKGRDDGAATGIIKPPAEQQAEFKVAEGYTVNLFASEVEFPELRNPVQIAFDARGRLWVVTMPSFPHTVPGRPPEDKIIVLEDTDHDGKADKSTTFAEGLDALDGIAFSQLGVIVSEQPRLWVMNDTDGDGKADTKRELLRGIDVTDSHHGGMIATDPLGDVLFCDGVFHRSQIETPFGVVRGIDATTYRLHPRTGRVETEWQSITPNPWKITYDRTGNLFQMYGDGLVLDALPLTWTPLGVYHPFAYAKVVGYGKGSAAASISSPNFPDEYQQGMASASLLGNYTVSLTKFDYDKGMVRNTGHLDVVSSKNAAFRPADLAFGFDGALYVSDFCSAIIGHAQHAMRDPHWDHDHGRIWRVVSNAKPVVKDFPKIEGARVHELLALLQHPQDIVRHHARIELRARARVVNDDPEQKDIFVHVLPALDQWVAKLDRSKPETDQTILEALFLAESLGQTRPALLAELLKSKSPLHRAAAVRLVRAQADRLPNAADLLHQMAADPHPRVQMEVVDAVAHLRPTYPAVEHALHALADTTNADVKHMLNDLKAGTKPAKGRSVPVLEIAPETQLRHWFFTPTKGDVAAAPFDASAKSLDPKTNPEGLYRTFVQAEKAQPAILAVRHGYLDLTVNGVQILSTDSMWSNDQQAQFDLHPGLNTIELTLRNRRGAPPAVYLYDPVGQPLAGTRLATDEPALRTFAAAYDQANAALGNALRVQAVPNKMQFAPTELRVKAGAKVRLIFENPDVMMHNLLLLTPGSTDEIGALADQLATQPDGLAQNYLPKSPKILQATKLVQPTQKAELQFTAPTTPGRYPYLCTFPGHWRIMRGELIVE